MSLLRTEMARVTRRRITKVASIVGLLLVLTVGAVTFFTSAGGPPDAAQAEKMASLNEADCRETANWDGMSASELDAMCHQEASWYLSDERFHFQSLMSQGTHDTWSDARQSAARTSVDFMFDLAPGVAEPSETPAPGFRGGLPGFGIALFLVAALLGATFVGADWRSKVIETQLTWQPNRQRLMLAKVGAAAIVSSAVASTLAIAFVVAHLPATIFRGDFAGTGPRFFLDLALAVGRISLAALAVAALAGSVAMLARSTVAGVGTVFVLGMAGTIAVGLAGRVSVAEFFQNFGAWISSGDVSREVELPLSGGGTMYAQIPLHGVWIAGAVVAAYVAVAYALGRLSFGRRDIT